MKKWLKNHWWALIGHTFIWLVPLISLVILTYQKVEAIKYLNIVGVVGCVLFILVYYKKLKTVIRDKMLEKNIKNEPIWLYRILQFINFGLGFLIFYLLYDFGKMYLDQIKTFIVLFFCEGTFGYICLVIDGIGGGNDE